MVTSSPSTSLITGGPVMNIWLVPRTMTMKSVSAGEYDATPMHGPITAEICGMAPDAMLFSKKISPMAEVTLSPSWMRAPTES